MTERDFIYWIQGFSELNGECPPTRMQWKQIKDHLALVFKKETPFLVPDWVSPPPGYRDNFAGIFPSGQGDQPIC